MTIVCGTDFSPRSVAHCHDAAALARAEGGKLVLVHAVARPLAPMPDGDAVLQHMIESAGGELRRIAKELRESTGADVSERVELGSADEVITAVARTAGASMIVVSATSRPMTRWLLGSSADRIASAAETPIVVLREGFPAREWAGGKRPLRVAVATDLSAVSDDAISWAAGLTRFGECTYVLVHVSWPPEVYRRLAIDDPMPLDSTHPVVEKVIRRELGRAAERLRAAGPCETVVESSFGRPADALNRLAKDAGADVLVVGHHADRLWSVWEGSVARRALRTAEMSVICVPDTAEVTAGVAPRPLRHVVAATDLSRSANDAVAYAVAAAEPGGRVTILRVLDDETTEDAARASLAKLVDRHQKTRPITLDVDVVRSHDPAQAICAYAERHDADLICIAQSGGSRLPRILFGSVAQEILLVSRLPVLVIPTA
jgi:nucleotide-binding universal stress UspA family protein